MSMFRKDLSRRGMMKGALKASAYSAPVILAAATAHGVGAVSPPRVPGSGTVTFSRSGIVQGTGFTSDTPFLLILFNPPESGFHLLQPVMTDANGGFTLDTGSQSNAGTIPAPGTVNGGNIFVHLADTFGGTPPTMTPTPTSAPTRTPFPPTIPPTPTVGGRKP